MTQTNGQMFVSTATATGAADAEVRGDLGARFVLRAVLAG